MAEHTRQSGCMCTVKHTEDMWPQLAFIEMSNLITIKILIMEVLRIGNY